MHSTEALVDRSLIVASMTEPVRFRLLEIVRQFAARRLDDSGETAIGGTLNSEGCTSSSTSSDRPGRVRPGGEGPHRPRSDHRVLRRVGAEACRINSGSGSSSVLSDAVDELLRMQLMYTSTHGLLLACAAAVSGARYTDAARYSSLALECTEPQRRLDPGGPRRGVDGTEPRRHEAVGTGSAPVGLRGRHPRPSRRHRTTDVHRLQAPLITTLVDHLGDRAMRDAERASSELSLDDIVHLAFRAHRPISVVHG